LAIPGISGQLAIGEKADEAARAKAKLTTALFLRCSAGRIAVYSKVTGPNHMTSSPSLHPLILCIDDAEIALRVRKLLLANAGYSVLTAASGEEGLELFKQHPVELVIADHFLSDKTGAEIAHEMRDFKPQVPILIVSAAAEEPAGLEFADGFLSKGEGPDLLLETIAGLLRRPPAQALTNSVAG
jgi:CheY-like chemotaxis protein